MPSFKNLEIAAAVSQLPYIQVNKSFFGLVQKVIYTPTESQLQIIRNDYTSETGDRIKKILNSDIANMEKVMTEAGSLNPADTGPFRLEAVVSTDKQFAAIQAFGYSDFQYKPLNDIRYFQGHEAEIVAKLF